MFMQISCLTLSLVFFLTGQHVASLQARSEVQECAIAVGLLMFGIILERFIEVLKESLNVGAPVVILGETRKTVDK